MKKEIKKQIEKKDKKKSNIKWIVKITILAFIISIVFSMLSELIKNFNIIVAIIILFIFISIGILFDMIGIAVASADEEPFHSMSSRKIKGAKLSVKLKRNADKVSSFCNDVIGDICGIISGTIGVTISINVANIFNISTVVTGLIITGIISAVTIGGKAIGKTFAINRSNVILYEFSKTLSIFYKK